MFSYINLALFTKKGNLLPLNTKSGIIITIHDDFGGDAIFYPIVAESTDRNVYIQGYKKIQGGRFLQDRDKRQAIIHIGTAVETRICKVKYSTINTGENIETIYSIEELSDYSLDYKILNDSLLAFPSILLSQKLIFDKVSTELYETEFLYVLAETIDENGVVHYVKVNELTNNDQDIREWAERYKLLFFIDCRDQEDFRLFTVTNDEVIWSDRAELDLINNTVKVNGETIANYPMGWNGEDSNEYHVPRIDLGFSGKEEGTYRQILHICLLDMEVLDENNIPNIIPIGEIELVAEAEGEDERYRTLFTNFGIPDPKDFDHVYKESYVEDDKPDFISINRHSKEMFLEYDKIFPYIGTYRALINAVHLLGYDDIFFKEWYKVLDVSNEIPRGYIAYNMSYKNSGYNATLASLPLEKRIHLRKKNWLSMLYSLNRELYHAPDEYDFPYIEELYEYRTEESLLKLISLREWLEKYVMALNCRIIDIGGEGIYFERYGLHIYGDIQTNLEHTANLNLIPYIADTSLSNTKVLQDCSAFITIKAAAKIEERRFSDFEDMTFSDFCEGVIDENNIYHTYDGSIEGRYIGTIIAGFYNRITAKLNAVSTADTFIIGEDGYISDESPRLIISNNEISFIPEDIVFKEKNTAFKRMPVILLEQAVLRTFTDTWEKSIRYVIYPENNPSTGISYYIENKISREKIESTDYIYLIPPLYKESEDTVKIIPRNNITNNAFVIHDKRKHYHYTSDFDNIDTHFESPDNSVIKEYTSDDTTYGFRVSANNAYEIPLISIQGYSVKRPVKFNLPINSEFYLDIIKGKLIFDDFEKGRRIYIIFDMSESGERTIAVKFSYFTDEFELCKYHDASGNTFEHFMDGSVYTNFINFYDTNTFEAIDYNLYKDIKVYNAGEFKVNLSVRDVYGELYSADAPNTAIVITEQPLITVYTNEPESNNEYNRHGKNISADDIAALYNDFCYFGYKVKYPILQTNLSENYNKINYPNYPYSGDIPKSGMITHYGNFNDKFKIVAYDKFITHKDCIDWNYYFILNRQNRYRGSRITEKNDIGAIREMYTGNIHTGTSPMARVCPKLFEDAIENQSENFDVTVMFYNEVGAFPIIQLPGQIVNAKALDNLHAKSPFQEHYQEPWGYYDDEYHLLLSHDITNCYEYKTDNKNIGNIVSFMQDGIEWLVKTVFSEGYGSLWEYDYIPTDISERSVIGKSYAYDIIDNPELIDAFNGYYIMPSEHLPLSGDITWDPIEYEDLPNDGLLSGWLTYKGNPILSHDFIDHDTRQVYNNVNYKVMARMAPDASNPSYILYRVPSFDAKFTEINGIFSPYYAITPKLLTDMIPDLVDDPNISIYIYPYWRSEVRIVGVSESENRVLIQFENDKYKFPRAFKKGEMVKLIWHTGDSSNNISQSSYKVIGYDILGYVLILEGEICKSYASKPGKRYAYADIPADAESEYDVLDDKWIPDPNEVEDEPWITGYLAKNGNIDFTYTYKPENSFYFEHPDAFVGSSSGFEHTHTFRIPAGKFVDPSTNVPLIRYRIYSHDDIRCPDGTYEHGMFSPWYESIESINDVSLYISYAHNAFTDYKMPIDDYRKTSQITSLLHPVSAVNNKLTYYIDDTFKAVTRTFDTDNGILYWMNASNNVPLICLENIYAYNCPVTIYEKTPYTVFKIDYKNTLYDNQTILWRVYKSVDAATRELLFESWNKSLFLDTSEKGIYDIEVIEFDKYGNKAAHMYEGAYRVLSSEEDSSIIYHVNVTSELISGDGDYGYIAGGENTIYKEGDICVLKAIANYGYIFKGWSIGNVIIDTNENLMFVVGRNCDIKAIFDSVRYKLSVSLNNSEMGEIEINPEGIYTENGIEYVYNTKCTITVNPNAYNEYPNIFYSFVKWTDGKEDLSDTSSYSFNIIKDTNIIGIMQDKEFHITAYSNDMTYGTVEVNPNICTPGQSCTLRAIPTSTINYEFIGWYENNTSLGDSSVYIIQPVLKDYELMAKFKIRDVSQGTVYVEYDKPDASTEYALCINGNEISSSTGDINTRLLIDCSLRDVYFYQYDFIGWYDGNNKITSTPTYYYTINMASKTLTAKFRPATYTISGNLDYPSRGSNIPVNIVSAGETGVLSFNCYNPYKVKDYTCTGTCTIDSSTTQLLSNGDYKYNFYIKNIQSNIIFSFTTDMREEYVSPFYIIPAEDAKITIHSYIPSNFICMSANNETEQILNNTYTINIDAGVPLYIWTEKPRNSIFPKGETAFHSGMFVLTKSTSTEKCNFTAGGSIMSLLIPKSINGVLTQYGNKTLTNNNTEAFKYLFAKNRITDAKDLILPPNTKSMCYYRMFYDSSINDSPELKDTNVTSDAYKEMFYNCQTLKAIYTKQSSWTYNDGSLCNEDWVKGVSKSEGNDCIFYKTEILDTSYGDSWIPDNWIPDNWTVIED